MPGAMRSGWIDRLRAWPAERVASPGFQSWASGFPLTRIFARRDGAILFDLVAGFVYSQILQALVELEILEDLRAAPLSAEALALRHGMLADRMRVLMQGAVALRLVRLRRDGRYALARRGAAICGVPGLADMVRHHAVFYRDLGDPVAVLRGETETELSAFWPYVLGARGDVPRDVAARYSDLMARTQLLVAEDTLRTVFLHGARRLLDVGGGTGAFLEAVGKAYPDLALELFDLGGVADGARERFAAAGLDTRTTIHCGSFRDRPLPEGADVISLVRVLYDHEDATVADLLTKVHAALSPGGRLIISEPMTGGATPHRAGDAYYAFYTMAMGTGCARSAKRIGELCQRAGFTDIRRPRPRRDYITRVVTAVKPG